jgi:beta-galactosidase
VTLRPGANTVTVTASIDGTTHTDTVTWTLTTA